MAKKIILQIQRLILTQTICLCFCAFAYAEYRVFELDIEDTTSGVAKRVTSTLDHLQYSRYNPIRSTEVVKYVTSWMCYENTSDFRPFCKRPEPKN